MADARNQPVFVRLARRPASRRRTLRSRSRRTRAFGGTSHAESGVWRLEDARSPEALARRPVARAWRSALACCAAVVFLGGTIALCAISLVEIAERLVELGGDARRVDSD